MRRKFKVLPVPELYYLPSYRRKFSVQLDLFLPTGQALYYVRVGNKLKQL